MTLSDYLRATQQSDAQFAREIGVKRQYVQRYRNGRIPAPEIMSKIAEATGGQVTANDFFGLAA